MTRGRGMPRTRALAKQAQATIFAADVTVTAVNMAIAAETDQDRWLEIGKALQRFTEASQWWWGDWSLFGADKAYGEIGEQAADIGINEQTLRHYRKVARAFELCRRRHNLSWAHHEAVLGLSDHSKQDKMLARAEAENWSVADLRARVRHDKNVELGAGDWLQVYDVWNFAGCDPGFGQEHPGRIPGQIILNVLHYFTESGDLVVDPMAGGGTTIDACREFGRRCVAFDIEPRRSDIVRHDATHAWPRTAQRCALVFVDPPYWDMRAEEYGPTSISALALDDFYLALEKVMQHAHAALKDSGYLALLLSPSASPEHGFIDHQLEMQGRALAMGFTMAWRVSVPQSSQTINAREVAWTKEQRRMLSLIRDLAILQKA